jgi:hypothetical protein
MGHLHGTIRTVALCGYLAKLHQFLVHAWVPVSVPDHVRVRAHVQVRARVNF